LAVEISLQRSIQFRLSDAGCSQCEHSMDCLSALIGRTNSTHNGIILQSASALLAIFTNCVSARAIARHLDPIAFLLLSCGPRANDAELR
jgi:hypothetical protein